MGAKTLAESVCLSSGEFVVPRKVRVLGMLALKWSLGVSITALGSACQARTAALHKRMPADTSMANGQAESAFVHGESVQRKDDCGRSTFNLN
jgi:hypothetical protein